MNVGPAPRTLAPASTAPEVLAARDRAFVAAEQQLRKMADAQVAEAGVFKRPLVKFGWSLVFGLLLRIVAFVVERLLDDLAAMPPDVLMALAVRRKEEVRVRKSPPAI